MVTGAGAETNEPDGYRAATTLLDEHPDVTAVFAANDTMALGAFAALGERGLRVPQDVSLVGFDNSPLASSHTLDLTTVDDRGAEVGSAVTRSLLSRIDDPTLPPRTTLVEPSLVVRSSTAAARR
ncbi:hypothetical protein GCM10025867_20450 [Frondihabitans sucicola]|uniref:Transcriptional regulator LacI/GalR-like sensor domain-containing protein n=1 Tax=Frondihabitans sucicola TaxID=1268041 RepID=A0ABM8GMY8_9MICO|nr:hypothetical protein GCM10025867_20450 [Frondihabitans sucicola]